jgi:hypothetical protein
VPLQELEELHIGDPREQPSVQG